MINLASIVNKQDVEQALKRLIREKPDLNNPTRYRLKYKGQYFPPKEVIRYAAREKGLKESDLSTYRLQGGPPTNRYLTGLGFTIEQFADWEHHPKRNNEKRVARICWNDQGWIKPSGIKGKSKYKDSHEARFGYGHEEWLFDVGKIVDGYHYGFLEPVRKQQDAYTGNTYTIWLYTIDDRTKKRYWVGEILNAEVIQNKEAEIIKKEYIRRGWLSTMEDQIRKSGANPTGFSNYKGVDLFNIRFKLNDYRLNEPYIELPKSHPINDQSRYSFGRFDDNFHIELNRSEEFHFIPDSDKAHVYADSTGISLIREEKEVQINYLHSEICTKLTKYLINVYGKRNVRREHPAGYGDNRIDIVVNTKSGMLFFEIKTYPSVRTSIREALGQIIEYAMWPDKNRAKEMIIVTQPTQEIKEIRKYMSHLRNRFDAPIYYQSFDINKCILSDKS